MSSRLRAQEATVSAHKLAMGPAHAATAGQDRAQGSQRMYKTLLVPIDIGDVETAGPALDRAVALADGSNGTIRLIHVRSLVPVAYMEFVPATFDLEQQRDAESRLADLAASVAFPAERISTVVRLGSVYNEVLQEAETTGSDLIVVGSHRPTMATYLLGSNASAIVRHATCSVLVVRP